MAKLIRHATKKSHMAWFPAVLTAVLVLAPAPLMVAAQPGPRAPEQMLPRVIERMTRRLDLSAEQRAAIEPILAEHLRSAEAVRKEHQERIRAERRAMRDEMYKERERMDAELAKILSPAQMEQLRVLRREQAERRMHRRERMGRRGDPGRGRPMPPRPPR